MAKVEADVYFAANPWDNPPPQFQPFIMHLPTKESLCAPCHNMNPTAQEFNSFDPRKNPCNSCHKRMLNKKHVHGPAGVLECATCHDATSKPAKYAIEGTGNDLCLECHEDKFDDFKTNKYMHGPVETGTFAFLAEGQGRYEFFLGATDVAGNQVQPTDTALAVYEAPEPIILVDRRGEAFDVTNAVLRHGIHLMFWGHGIGRHTIRPVIDPVMIGPGHRDYPPDTNFEQVCAVSFEGDNRAYRLSDLNDKEVANDTVAGVPIAVSY